VSTFATSHVAADRSVGARRRPVLHVLARAWNSLSWRQWLLATGAGVLAGAINAIFRFLYSLRGAVAEYPDLVTTHMLLVMLTNRVLLMTGVACILAFALALLREWRQRAAIRPRDVALTIFVVSTFAPWIVLPVSNTAAIAVHSALHLPGNLNPFAEGADLLTVVSRMYSELGEPVLTFVATVTMAVIYYSKGLRTSDALSVAQLGLSQVQKRRLTEELRTAQAALDPDFLFATLAEVDRRFGSDLNIAQRLLDALIRYLRAALPAKDDAIGTLGQQATLARAYLEIESIRSGDRVQGVIDVPVDLEARLFAPALILPMVALVCGDAAGSGRDTEILLKASVAAGRLTVEIRGNGSEARPSADVEAILPQLRQRISALYGERAELSFATRAPRGSTAKIVIDDPGNP
jgi:hypothetical protein